MPLVGENRRLVREGLRALARTARPGLRALMAESGVDPSALGTHALAFRLAPRINAAGRLQRADAGLELLLTGDERRAAQIASELERVNAERRAVEQRIVWEAEAQVAEQGERHAYVLAGDGWHPGVVGIVASRVVERHHRPAVVVGLDGDAGSGSGRSIPGFDLLAGLHASAAHLERYGGHRAAAGMTIRRERLDAFRAAFERHAERGPDSRPARPARARGRDRLGRASSAWTWPRSSSALEPCGMGNPRPRLLVPGAALRDRRPMGEGRHAALLGRVGRGQRPGGRLRLRRAARPVDGGGARRCHVPARAQLLERRRRAAPRPRSRATVPRRRRSRCWASPTTTWRACSTSSTRDPSRAGAASAARTRAVLDRRGREPARGACATRSPRGGEVLAVCADVAAPPGRARARGRRVCPDLLPRARARARRSRTASATSSRSIRPRTPGVRGAADGRPGLYPLGLGRA